MFTSKENALTSNPIVLASALHKRLEFLEAIVVS
jgi:hypothetical protein